VAGARPRFGVYFEKVVQRGVDCFICLDVSRSMLAEDVAPNRLQRAKSDILDLLRKLAGDHVGLIVFAGKPVVEVPLTTDEGFLRAAEESVVRLEASHDWLDLIPVTEPPVIEPAMTPKKGHIAMQVNGGLLGTNLVRAKPHCQPKTGFGCLSLLVVPLRLSPLMTGLSLLHHPSPSRVLHSPPSPHRCGWKGLEGDGGGWAPAARKALR